MAVCTDSMCSHLFICVCMGEAYVSFAHVCPWENTPVYFCILAYVFQEAYEGLYVCKGEGACMHVCPGMICE